MRVLQNSAKDSLTGAAAIAGTAIAGGFKKFTGLFGSKKEEEVQNFQGDGTGFGNVAADNIQGQLSEVGKVNLEINCLMDQMKGFASYYESLQKLQNSGALESYIECILLPQIEQTTDLINQLKVVSLNHEAAKALQLKLQQQLGDIQAKIAHAGKSNQKQFAELSAKMNETITAIATQKEAVAASEQRLK